MRKITISEEGILKRSLTLSTNFIFSFSSSTTSSFVIELGIVGHYINFLKFFRLDFKGMFISTVINLLSMAFKKFFERKMLKKTLTIGILFLILSIIQSNLISSDNHLNEKFIFFSPRSSSIENTQTQTILDAENRLHVFLRENFANDSFVIYHIFGIQTAKIFQGEYAENYWKVEQTSEGIVLFFAYKTYFGHYTFDVYVWNDTTSEIKTLYSYDPRWKTPKYYFYIGDGVYHLLLAEIVSTQIITENSQTLVKHYVIAENGEMNVTKMYLDLDFPGLRQLIWHNGTLYAFYAIHPSYQTTYDFVLLKFNANMTDVSVVNWFQVREGPFSSWVYVSNNGTFYLMLQQITDLFIAQFNANITLSFKNITKISPGLLSIDNIYGVAFDDHLTLFMYSDLYIYYTDFFATKQTRLDLAIIHWSNSNITADHFSLTSRLQNPKYYSLSVHVTEDDNYVLTQSTSIDSKDLSDLQVREKNLIAISIITTRQDLNSLQVQYYHLTPVSALQLFWERSGFKLTIALGIIVLLVIIFHKYVKRTFKRLKGFLTRPISGSKYNVISLIFRNSWIWLANFFGVIFILFKTNKKRHLITLIGLSLFTIVLTTSFILYDSKKQSVLLEYSSNIDFLNNKSPSITISRSYNVQAFSEIEPFDSNFTAKIFSEIFGTIVDDTGVLERIIKDYEYSLSAEMILTPEIHSNTRLVFDYCSISHSYENLLNELLINGSFPETSGEVLISEDLATLAVVHENSTVFLWGSNYLWNLGSDYLNASVTGIYHKPSEQELMRLCMEYNVPYDAVMFLTEPYVCLTWHRQFEEHFIGFYPYKMPVTGSVQFLYDFSKMTVDDVNYLINEVNKLIDNNYHFFKWLTSGYWVYGQELKAVPYLIGTMNCILHGLLHPNIVRKDTFEENVVSTPSTRFDVILTNPPFGEDRKWEPKTQQEKEQAEMYELWNIARSGKWIDLGLVFLENAYRILKEGGRMKSKSIYLSFFILIGVFSFSGCGMENSTSYGFSSLQVDSDAQMLDEWHQNASVDNLGKVLALISEDMLDSAEESIRSMINAEDTVQIKEAVSNLLKFVEYIDSIGYFDAIAGVILDPTVPFNKDIRDIPGLVDTLLSLGLPQEHVDSIFLWMKEDMEKARDEFSSSFIYGKEELSDELFYTVKGNINEVLLNPGWTGGKAINGNCIGAILEAGLAVGGAIVACSSGGPAACYLGYLGASYFTFKAYWTCTHGG